MLPAAQQLIDLYPEVAPFFLDGWQFFDLTALEQIIETMCEEDSSSDYPLFETPPPADKVIIDCGLAWASLERRNGGWYMSHPGYDAMRIYRPDLRAMDFPVEMHTYFVKEGTVVNPEEDLIKMLKHNGHVENHSVAFVLSVALHVMSIPQLAGPQVRKAQRAFRRRHDLHNASYVEYTFERREKSANYERPDEKTHEKRFHFCSGHWRRSPKGTHMIRGEMRTWIRGTWKGNPELGIVLKKYKAVGEKA